MLLLWCFGQELERIYGTREFYGFYLVALLASAAAHLALASATGIHAGAIGASGAVMGMLAIYWRYFPRRILLLFGVLPLEVRWVVLLYVAFDLYPVLQSLGGAQASDGVAHAAHLGGFVFGLVYHTFNLRITNWTWRPRRRPAAPSTHLPNLRVFTEPQTPDESIDSEVDRILAKISRHGEASLTEAERSALQEASRRFRIRRQ